MQLTEEQKAALDLAVLNLKTHGDDQLLVAVMPLIRYYESTAHNAGTQGEAVAWQFRERGTEHWVACPKQPTHLADHDFEKRPLYAHPRPMTDVARERPSVVLAYSTKGHNKPCGQTIGANGCGEFVTVYYGDVDAAGRSARDHLGDLEKAGHRFNWALVMRSDEEAYHGPAMTFAEIERLDRAKGE